MGFAITGGVHSAECTGSPAQQWTAEPAATTEPEPIPGKPKNNERPIGNGLLKPAINTAKATKEPLYRYEFTQPEFLINRIVIHSVYMGFGGTSWGWQPAPVEATLLAPTSAPRRRRRRWGPGGGRRC